MKRKAIQLANQTLVVSLPAKWVKQQGIKKGDEIDVEERGRELALSTEKNFQESKKIINIKDFGIIKNRIILSYYLRGIDELEIKFTNLNQVKEIKERVLNELIGFEIIKQTSDSMILKDISTSSGQDFNSILRRIFLIIDSSAKELVNSSNKRNIESIILTDSTINRLCYYCIRILNKIGYKDYKKTPSLYSTILILEWIGDIYKYIAKEIIENKIILTKTDRENLKLINDLFNNIRDILFKQNIEDILLLAKNYETLKKRLNKNAKINLYLNNLLSDIIMINNNLLMII